MGKKKTPEPKNDFAGVEDLDVCSFSENPIIEGNCIATFSFSDNTTDKINESAINISNNIATSESASTETINFNNSCSNNTTVHTDANTNDISNSNSDIANITEMDKNNSNTPTSSTSQVKTLLNNENTLADNRKAPIVNGCAPTILGEYLDVKRTYMLRSSTVRKLNELKSINHDLNTYVSTIVDLAIAHYYDHIINDGDTK